MSDTDTLRDRITQALKKVYDPELPINIYDLGLIYEMNIEDDGSVGVRMTLTTPNCPMAETIVTSVRDAITQVEGVTSAEVELVWEPGWSPELMTDDAEFELLAMGIDPKRAHESIPNRPTDVTIGSTEKRNRKT